MFFFVFLVFNTLTIRQGVLVALPAECVLFCLFSLNTLTIRQGVLVALPAECVLFCLLVFNTLTIRLGVLVALLCCTYWMCHVGCNTVASSSSTATFVDVTLMSVAFLNFTYINFTPSEIPESGRSLTERCVTLLPVGIRNTYFSSSFIGWGGCLLS